MRVDCDGGQALHRGDIAQMGAEARLVDREIVVERQQHGRDDALGYEIRMAAHVSSPPVQTTGTRFAATAAGEITSISSGTCQRSVKCTCGGALLARAPFSTKPS